MSEGTFINQFLLASQKLNLRISYILQIPNLQTRVYPTLHSQSKLLNLGKIMVKGEQFFGGDGAGNIVFGSLIVNLIC